MSESEGGLKTAFFISGGGTNMAAAVEASQTGVLNGLINPVVVISSDSQAEGVARAKGFGIPTETVYFGKTHDVSGQIKLLLRDYKVDLAVLAGWIRLIPADVVTQYEGRMINIHPAPLDPGREDFGGQGMYGLAPHIAVISYEAMTGDLKGTAGVSHLVTPEFDKGSLIRRVVLPLPFEIPRMDYQSVVASPKTILELATQLQRALLPLERQNLVATLELIAKSGLGNIPTIDRGGRLIDTQYLEVLKQAKQFAIALANSKL